MIFGAFLAFTLWLVWTAYSLYAYRPHSIAGKTVLITSGGTSLGQKLAVRLVKLGARVVVWDSRKDRLEKLAALGTSTIDGASIRTALVDMSARLQVQRVARELGHIDVIVFAPLPPPATLRGQPAAKKEFLDESDDAIEKTVVGSTMGPIWVLRALLPGMIARNQGHVAFIAEEGSFADTPLRVEGMVAKNAICGLHESLYHLLRRGAGGRRGVRMTALFPYRITPEADADGSPRTAPKETGLLFRGATEAEVADRLIQGICRGEERIVMPFAANLLPALRLLPMCWAAALLRVGAPRSDRGAASPRGRLARLLRRDPLTDSSASNHSLDAAPKPVE